MTVSRPMRVALLCHSVNPRGGVVHAFELAAALAALGHEPVIHAPDPEGRGFFRKAGFETVTIRGPKVAGKGTTAMVVQRIEDYLAHFAPPAARRFDVFHAQDGISGNALATLKRVGHIGRFARTVHHLDDFADPELDALQSRAVTSADGLFVVSETWRTTIRARFGREATLVGNGVDLRRYGPDPDGREAALRVRFGLGTGPVILAVGGVEERKNTRRILEAFAQLRRIHGAAQLLIAGGASLLDHSAYQLAFDRDLAETGLPEGAVIVTGPLADEDMPAVYRVADALAFPSIREGFGLVVLEAMASGLPVVASSVAPFTEYLGPDDVVWCNPLSSGSIADAMTIALSEPMRSRLAVQGATVAARHDWAKSAEVHLGAYTKMREAAHA